MRHQYQRHQSAIVPVLSCEHHNKLEPACAEDPNPLTHSAWKNIRPRERFRRLAPQLEMGARRSRREWHGGAIFNNLIE